MFLAGSLVVNESIGQVTGTSTGNLGDLSIQDLLNESVTSVSKKETKLDQSPAAIAVLTPEDIRRSGASTIAEALRMVPGLDVARISSDEWAVSSRGFNSQFANKLLVLIDGRTVYSPTFSGVNWNVQDLVMEDLDRIEVIRGPGATLWGANAVNGVINIITKSAKDTQGGLVTTSYGTEDRPSVAARYGGELATNLYYRVYGKYFDRDHFNDQNGTATADAWNAGQGGFRLDWEPSLQDQLTLQGDYFQGQFGENVRQAELTPPYYTDVGVVGLDAGVNVLGRWTHSFSESSELSLQLYYDHERHSTAGANTRVDTYDSDLQYRFALGNRQDVMWGLGYRYEPEFIGVTPDITFMPATRRDQLVNTFLQDEITLVEDRLKLTLGTKVEHNDYTGFELEPGGRVAWTPDERQTVWASVSRALRTPAPIDTNIRFDNTVTSAGPNGPLVVARVLGNPDLDSEELIAYEIGYRVKPLANLSLDLTAYYNDYHGLATYAVSSAAVELVPPPPHLAVGYTPSNAQAGGAYGTEIAVQWRVLDSWKLIAAYTWLEIELKPPGIAPTSVTEGDNPKNQFQVRSYLNLPHDLEFNAAMYYVDHLPDKNIEAHMRVDLGLTWHVTPAVELSVWGQNLIQPSHAEFTSYTTPVLTEIPRSVFGKLVWRF